MTARAPIDAPAPIVTNGPIDASGPTTALLAIALSRSMPGGGAVEGISSLTACAKATYGSLLRSTAHGAGKSSAFAGPRIAADARVAARCGRYFGLLTKVT